MSYCNHQPLDQIYSSLLTKTPKQVSLAMPSALGSGTIQHSTARNGVMLLDWHTRYDTSVRVQGPSIPEYLHIFFCFRDGMMWDVKNRQSAVYIDRDESYIYRGHGNMEYAEYLANRNYHYTGIKIPWTNLTEILHRCLSEPEIAACEKRLASLCRIPISNHIRQALADIMAIPHDRGGIESMLLESRMIGLLALYFGELLEIPSTACPVPVSPTDRAALLDIKRQIDRQFDYLPGCEELARQAHMSISKFSKSFAALFGMPVHTYIIHRRLDHAARMLEDTDLTISEVSARVGYTKPSNFAAAFRKRYGINPRTYRNTDFG